MMGPKTKLFRFAKMLSVVMILTLLAAPANVGATPNVGQATHIRLNGRSAEVDLNDGEQYGFLYVTRDEIANTTSLSYQYRFPDPNAANLSIVISGGEAEIPNSAFSVTSTSAQLTVTTPDSYPVTRCVVNNDSGEYTCAPAGPSTFDLMWIANGDWTLHEALTNVETFGKTTSRSSGRYDTTMANVSGVWDGHSGTNLTGHLTDSENFALFREPMMEANPLFRALSALPARKEATQTPSAKRHTRGVSSFLAGDGLNGFVQVWHDEIANSTGLAFGYAFPDPNDPSATLVFAGGGEIPNNAFSITSASARLTVTTPDSFYVVRCVITDIIGNPGAYTCAPAAAPLTFDLTWLTDGYGAVHATSTSVETLGSVTTRYHGQYNQVTANGSGTWNEFNEHAGTNTTGVLTDLQDVTIGGANP